MHVSYLDRLGGSAKNGKDGVTIHDEPDKLKQKIIFEVQQVFYTRTIGAEENGSKKGQEIALFIRRWKNSTGTDKFSPFCRDHPVMHKSKLWLPGNCFVLAEPRCGTKLHCLCFLIKEPGLKEPNGRRVSGSHRDLTSFHGGKLFN